MCNSKVFVSQIVELITQFNSQWRKQYPTLSYLNGGINDRAIVEIDQLSDESLLFQLQLVKRYQKAAQEIKSSNNAFDNSLKKEFLRSLSFKQNSLENSKYKEILKPYLDLIIMNLLVNEENLFGNFEEIFSNIINVLSIAYERNLLISRKEIKYINSIKEYLEVICPCNIHAQKYITDIQYLLSKFRESTNLDSRKNNKTVNPLDSLNSALKYSYETKEAKFWLGKIKARLKVDINNINIPKEINNKIPYYGYDINEELFEIIIGDLKQINGNPTLKPFKYKRLHSVFNYVTNEGFYVGNPSESTLYLSNRIFTSKQIHSRKSIAYLYVFLAHEIFPGHHNQYSSINNNIIIENYDLLHNPLSLEGYAVLGEQHVLSIDFKYYVSMYNLKKLIPTAIYLESLIHGKSQAEKLLNEIFQYKEILDVYKESNGFGAPNIVYTIGFLECLDLLEKGYYFNNGLGAITYRNFGKIK